MNWVRALAGLLVLWSGTVWGATLTWTANSEPDLAGYRVYQCNQQPCTRSSGQASLLATLGTVTSINIGTPAVTQHYFVTAYDSANNESAESSPATYTPVGSPPPVVPPVIGASPTNLSFAATQGGSSPAPQTLTINNQGGGTLSWRASENAPWLTLSPASGTGNGTVTFTVATGTLTPGSYTGTVTVTATSASSVTVPVTFIVSTAPVPPAIGTSPTNLSFMATQGGVSPATQTLNISNTGGGTLSWAASDNSTWLRLSPASGTDNGIVTVRVVTGTTAVGTYTDSITINAVGASPVTVPVTFTVSASPPSPPPPPPPAAPPIPGGLQIISVQ